MQFAIEAAKRGERAVLFEFEESAQALFKRSEGLGFSLRKFVDEGAIDVRHIRAGEITPNEFAMNVRSAVEVDGQGRRTSVVLIDSLKFEQQVLSELTLIANTLTLVGLFVFLRFMAERSIFHVVAWLTALGKVLSWPTVGMYYGMHE